MGRCAGLYDSCSQIRCLPYSEVIATALQEAVIICPVPAFYSNTKSNGNLHRRKQLPDSSYRITEASRFASRVMWADTCRPLREDYQQKGSVKCTRNG